MAKEAKENKAKKRIEYIDIAKGIAIILVIIGHTVPDGSFLKDYIYGFHMPLFFLVSGYFFKERPVKEYVRKQGVRLMVPYAVTAVGIIALSAGKKVLRRNWPEAIRLFKVQSLAAVYGSGMDMPLYRGSSTIIPDIGAIWFLPAIFFGLLILNLSLKCRHSWVVVLISAAAGMISVHFVWLPMSIQPGMVAVVFLYTGYLSRKYQLIEKVSRVWIVLVSVPLTFVGPYICGCTILASNSYRYGPVNLLFAFPGMLVILYISKVIEVHSPKLNGCFRFFGADTLIILCTHCLEMKGLTLWRVRDNLAARYAAYAAAVYLAVIVIRVVGAAIAVFLKRRIKLLQKIF
ncbi:MAG: acyltransferase family protein [Ruminococcus sp.]|nr:acyltransferase family protein [Ruminococcus sp.]